MKNSILERAARGTVRVLASTWRLEIVGADHVERLRECKTPIVFAVWHAFLLPALWHRRNEGITLLISDHTDGGYVARSAIRWGYRVVRGSSTRGAIKGSIGIVRSLESGGDVAFTPDGPTGPPRVAKAGAVAVAARAGAAIIAVGAGASSRWQLRSWDQFNIPRPFARVRLVYDEPLKVGNGVGYTEDQALAALGKRLDAVTEAAAC